MVGMDHDQLAAHFQADMKSAVDRMRSEIGYHPTVFIRMLAQYGPSAVISTSFRRMSFAHLAAGGAFSAYPGVDRVIFLVRGGRMTLTITRADGTRVAHDLGRFKRICLTVS